MLHSAAVFLPLLGALLAGFGGKWLGDKGAQIVTSALVGIAALCSIAILIQTGYSGETQQIVIARWISVGSFEAEWALRFDTLTAVMVFVVTVVSTMVHVYAVGYMHHDETIPRFMAYLSLFTFAMLMLVTADNLVQVFFGWEGVGVASYLLIGYWFERDSANKAAMKAFIVNRVGDMGLALGVFATFMLFDSVRFDVIFADAPSKAAETFSFLGMEVHALTLIGLLLFIGAMGKSAQLGLHTWLPDAMEGPTPVSALIHAATMVTAGVFLMARMSPLLEYAPTALEVITVVGGLTAIFAATVALTQNDIKRVIAYSTCSQLGYMFFAIGVSAYSAAIFHLMTHAFFKALLFLGAGSVIHAMSDEQDMRRMGGIWRQVPITYAMMLIGSLALAGVGIPLLKIGFAGFYSKDIVLEAAYAAHTGVGTFAFWMGVIAAFLTAFYSWRLLIMTFHGAPRADEKVMAHIHESPKVMLIPLFVLCAGALFAGALGYPHFVGDDRDLFWGAAIFVSEGRDSIEAAHHVPTWVLFAPLIVGLAGIAMAYVFYMFVPSLPATCARVFRPLYLFSYNKWYFDELYDFLFVRPAGRIGAFFWKAIDAATIDRLGPNGAAFATKLFSRGVAALQTGYVYHYAFAMLIGVFLAVSAYVLL